MEFSTKLPLTSKTVATGTGRWYWNRIGRQCYPHAESILLLFDCGGSNAANKFIVKDDLQ